MSPSEFVPGTLQTYEQRAPRYVAIEYVCDGLIRKPASTQGSITMRIVMAHRPTACRYALLQVPGQSTTLVVDLYETVVGEGGWAMVGKHWTFPDVETARAAIMLTYDEGLG